jgi:protein-disulfide isomerase
MSGRARLSAASVLALIAILAAACGGSDDGDPPTPGSSPAATGTATATPTPRDVLAAYAAMEIPEGLANGDTLGPEDAPITVALFEDFQCPFCLAFNLQFEETFVEYAAAGKIHLQFRHFVILGPESLAAARAAVCAAEQDVFWPFHNRLFLEQAKAGQLANEQLNVGRFSDANLRAYAADAGADIEAFDACFAAAATLARIQADINEARLLGLRGTPSVVIDENPVTTPRDLAALRRMLDDAIAAK